MVKLAVDAVQGEKDLDFLQLRLAAGALGAGAPLPDRGAFRRTLASEKVVLAIAREADSRHRVGFVRLDLARAEAELSLFVEPPHRRRGVGRALVSWARGRVGRRALFAHTPRGNLSARALFAASGFRCQGERVPGFLRWERAPA
jgi:GNAT superfamily N-acetyltransferase